MADNRGQEIIAVNVTFFALAAIAITLRCYVRLFMVRSFGLDDWLMVGALISYAVYTSVSLRGIHFGTGQRESDIDPENAVKARMFWWLCYLSYCFCMILSKVSIAVFLLRVATRRPHRWIVYGACLITIFTCITFFFVTIFQCSPISYFWDKNSQSGTCISGSVIVALAYIYSVFAVITDFTFAMLPVWIVMNLQMNRSTKLALVPLFGMGCVASAAVAVRFAYLGTLGEEEILYGASDIAIWSTVEEGLAIVAGSLATLRPLLKLARTKLGLTAGPSAPLGPSYYNKMSLAASTAEAEARRGSQSAHDLLRLNNLSSSPGLSGKVFVQHTVSVHREGDEITLDGNTEVGTTIKGSDMDHGRDKSSADRQRRSFWIKKPRRSESGSESVEGLRIDSRDRLEYQQSKDSSN